MTGHLHLGNVRERGDRNGSGTIIAMRNSSGIGTARRLHVIPPTVSVVVPTHCRPALLREALESVLAQTFRDYEVIVVSSNEDADCRAQTRSTCEQFGFVMRACDRGGVARARNVGARAARGVWLSFLDDDDVWLSTKLQKQLEAAADFGADMVACDYAEVGSDGIAVAMRRHRLKGRSWTAATSFSSWWTTPSATLISADAFRAVGGFCEWLRFGEDNDLWRRLSWRHRIHQQNMVLVRYRHGGDHDSMTQRRRIMMIWHFIHLMKMRFDTPRDLRGELPPWTFILGWMAYLASRSRALRFIVRKLGLVPLARVVLAEFK